MSPKRTNAGSHILLWSALLAVIIVGSAGVIKWQSSLMPQNINIPTPKMPSPNARDIYSAAEVLLRDNDQASYAMKRDPKIRPGISQAERDNPISGEHVFTLAEQQKLLAENMSALAKMHQGLQSQYFAPPDRSFGALFMHEPKDRALGRLVLLMEKVDEETGDYGGAINARLDDIQFGASLKRGAISIGVITGDACIRMGQGHAKETAALVDKLPASDARAAAIRLAAIDRTDTPMSQTMTEEKWALQAGLLEMFKRPDWKDIRLLSDDPDFGSIKNQITRARFLLESPRIAYNAATSDMDKVIRLTSLPWPSQKRAAPKFSYDPVASMVEPSYSETNYWDIHQCAVNRILEGQLALRAYDADHGAYPSSLAVLVPEYLPSVPIDPFSDNQPLKYRREGNRYVLYSVGPDCVDDGGKPMVTFTIMNIVDPQGRQVTSPTPMSPEYSTTDPNAKGDIVAGVNY